MWSIVEHGDHVPIRIGENRTTTIKPKAEWDEEDQRRVLLNYKAKNVIVSALNQDEFCRVAHYTITKEMWDILEIAHEGTSGVKENKLNTCIGEYESFRMKDGESVKDLHKRFTLIMNQLRSLGKEYTQTEKVINILIALPLEWQPKVTVIEEARGELMSSVTALFGSLEEYEGKLKVLKEFTQDKKKKSLVLKAESEDDDSEKIEEEYDEAMAILVRKFSKMYGKKKFQKFFKKKKGGTSNKKEGNEPIICYECKKPRHIKWECP